MGGWSCARCGVRGYAVEWCSREAGLLRLLLFFADGVAGNSIRVLSPGLLLLCLFLFCLSLFFLSFCIAVDWLSDGQLRCGGGGGTTGALRKQVLFAGVSSEQCCAPSPLHWHAADPPPIWTFVAAFSAVSLAVSLCPSVSPTLTSPPPPSPAIFTARRSGGKPREKSALRRSAYRSSARDAQQSAVAPSPRLPSAFGEPAAPVGLGLFAGGGGVLPAGYKRRAISRR